MTELGVGSEWKIFPSRKTVPWAWASFLLSARRGKQVLCNFYENWVLFSDRFWQQIAVHMLSPPGSRAREWVLAGAGGCNIQGKVLVEEWFREFSLLLENRPQIGPKRMHQTRSWLVWGRVCLHAPVSWSWIVSTLPVTQLPSPPTEIKAWTVLWGKE